MAVKTKRNRASSKHASKSESDFKVVAEEAQKYKVPVWLLWGIYGAESTYGTNGEFKFGGIDLPHGNTPNLRVAAREAAKALAGLHKQYGSWPLAVQHYSGNSYTIKHPAELAAESAGAAGVSTTTRRTRTSPTAPSQTQFVGLGEDLLGGGTGGSVLENFLNPLHLQPFGSEGPSAEGLETLPGSGDHTLNPFEPLQQAGSAIVAVASMITDVQFWIRVGEAVGALILIYMGLHSLTGQGPTPTSIAQTAAATKGL